MKKICFLILVISLFSINLIHAGIFDDFLKSIGTSSTVGPDESTIISGLKEALSIGTDKKAKKILNGGDTAATEFFKSKTHDKIYSAFKPIISSSMDEVGVTRSYKEMMGKYESLPFMSKESVDLDHYVTNKAMDGLFYMEGQEEKKIRTDPAARITDLLKTVFGNKIMF